MLALLLAALVGAAAPPPAADQFVVRDGARLTLAGKPYRFGGANVEWLGLVGYGPADPLGPRYPTHAEIDDALATAAELGARVVRAQTIGDSVGCERCLEPALGRFSDAAFEPIDYALKVARERGIRLIPTIVGDDAAAGGSGCVYLRWRSIDVPDCSIVNMTPFWTDTTVIGDVEEHIRALLEHLNRYTHVAYRDDPTILGWDLLNGGGSPTPWTRRIVDFVRSIDAKHLILSAANNAALPGVDLCVAFVYPHWLQPLELRKPEREACRDAGKPFAVYEYGWDETNFATRADLRGFLATLEATRLWPAARSGRSRRTRTTTGGCRSPRTPPIRRRPHGESGQWWALYYPGIQTLVSTAADMAARAQLIRTHNFRLAGLPVPPHGIPPAPVVTSIRYGPTRVVGPVGATVYWRGSAGAARYGIQRAPAASGPWSTVCNRCVTDLDAGWPDPSPAARTSWYRVIAYNLAGKPSKASSPRRT